MAQPNYILFVEIALIYSQQLLVPGTDRHCHWSTTSLCGSPLEFSIGAIDSFNDIYSAQITYPSRRELHTTDQLEQEIYLFFSFLFLVLLLSFPLVVHMADGTNPPLSYEASATTTHPYVGSTLPPEVIACLKNSRYVRCFYVSVKLLLI